MLINFLKILTRLKIILNIKARFLKNIKTVSINNPKVLRVRRHLDLLPRVRGLRDTLHDKAHAFNSIVKIGRTHLQDAVPLTLGQESSAWRDQLSSARHRIETSLQELYPLPLGGTAGPSMRHGPPPIHSLSP